MLLLVVIGLVGGIIFAKKIIDNTPDVSAEDIQPKGFTTTIVDQNGTVIDTLKDSDSNRVYRTYDEITAKTDFLRMHLWRSRTNVSMNITESIFREF